MYHLENTVRDYAWGSTDLIASLLGRAPSGGPEAELWIGAHPGAPSLVLGPTAEQHDGAVRLDEVIAADPVAHLGDEAGARYGRLPFLAKVLAAAAPLSLQVHPTLERARAGFAAQQAAGLAAEHPDSNYKDDNHKPEMLLALTEFTALCGFREPRVAAGLFAQLADSGALSESAREAAEQIGALLGAGDLPGAFTALLGGRTREVSPPVLDLVAQAPAAVERLRADGARIDPGLAELDALNGHYPGDPGVLISLLLNHVTLSPGQAIALPAGNVHAYLRGLGIEVMASSDNVLRGGLTPKHVDVGELLATVDFRPLPVPFVEPNETEFGQRIYRPGFEEFELQVLEVRAGSDVPVDQRGPAVVLVTSGALVLDAPTGDVLVSRGESVFLPATAAPVVARLAQSARATPGDDDGGSATAYAVTLPPRVQ
ncbi:mannose-6-phosphate isomerase, class I [Zhihengliuella halotolerans]|uniref:mannose-6-phosphate isomerase n=1 Tax=Zhihengliuella halotolerans TaxID=370736 RepID=A0A4Q8AD95_9MICC|nr:mannose-6-phosphate isomerase, class I [Zhihengliuella halotolerans]RZU62094.1 mannose-6-phosphate isomerase type 1 [Zhihengliuella halotolerans]